MEYVNEIGFTCDAIIYLRLNGHAGPDTEGWTNDERTQVNAILTVICAYNETEKDLLRGWILKCQAVSANPDALHILRQYGELIKHLGGNIMNKPLMEQFYKMILNGDNFTTALSLKAMLDELIVYRLERIVDAFKNDPSPFQTMGNWKDCDVYFMKLFWDKAHLGIDVWVEPESYLVEFWDRNDDEAVKGQAKAMLSKIGWLAEYIPGQRGFTKQFAFPAQEEALIKHIRSFKKKLSEAMLR